MRNYFQAYSHDTYPANHDLRDKMSKDVLECEITKVCKHENNMKEIIHRFNCLDVWMGIRCMLITYIIQ